MRVVRVAVRVWVTVGGVVRRQPGATHGCPHGERWRWRGRRWWRRGHGISHGGVWVWVWMCVRVWGSVGMVWMGVRVWVWVRGTPCPCSPQAVSRGRWGLADAHVPTHHFLATPAPTPTSTSTSRSVV